jgi:hypothetical protein
MKWSMLLVSGSMGMRVIGVQFIPSLLVVYTTSLAVQLALNLQSAVTTQQFPATTLKSAQAT